MKCKTLHIIAILLVFITSVQLIVFLHLASKAHESDDSDATPEEAIGSIHAKVAAESLGNSDKVGNRAPKTADVSKQSIGLRVLGNVAKIRRLIDEVEMPTLPEEALLVRAEDRYDPSAPSKRTSARVTSTSSPTTRLLPKADARVVPVLTKLEKQPSATSQPLAGPPSTVPKAKPQSPKRDLAPVANERPTAEVLIPVIGDLFEAEGRAIDELLERNRELNNALEVTRPPSTLTFLKDAALVVLAYNRPDYLEKTLNAAMSADLSVAIKKYVSQDGGDSATAAMAKRFSADFEHLIHPHEDLSIKVEGSTPGTAYVAAHYKWVLDTLFKDRGHSHVIILEDDLAITKDFLTMFESLAPLLDADPTLWCISSWNDNGFRTFELPEEQFFRTSYFPGLGWMLKKELWIAELSSKFPADNWDHWMRVSTTSKRRDCIVPWVSRNRNIGATGTTASDEFFMLYIKPIATIDDKTYRFKPYGDLRYLLSHRYYAAFRSKLLDSSTKFKRHLYLANELPPLSATSYQSGNVYVVAYTEDTYESAAYQLAIRVTPRATYRHTLWLRYNSADIFLVNRYLSPFADGSHRIRRDPSLVVVPAKGFGVSCMDTCFSHGSSKVSYKCDSKQFAFINDCSVLAGAWPQCGSRCTQGWGEDLPNVESTAIAIGREPMCLETEMHPTCEASHKQTMRLCPCVSDSGEADKPQAGGYNNALPAAMQQQRYQEEPANRAQQGKARSVWEADEGDGSDEAVADQKRLDVAERERQLVLVAADQPGVSCYEVCQSYQGGAKTPYWAKGWRCAPNLFHAVNDCDVLQKQFPCTSCHSSRGEDLPNYVSNRDDGQYGRCLVTNEGGSCRGSHPHTLRLCPCLPE